MDRYRKNEEIMDNIIHNISHADESIFQKQVMNNSVDYTLNLVNELEYCNVQVNMNYNTQNHHKQSHIKILNKKNEERLTILIMPQGSFPKYAFSVRNRRIDSNSQRKMLSVLSIEKIEAAINQKLNSKKEKSNTDDIVELPKDKKMYSLVNSIIARLDEQNLPISSTHQNNIEAIFQYIDKTNKNVFSEDVRGDLSYTYHYNELFISLNIGNPQNTFNKMSISISDKNGEIFSLCKHPEKDNYAYDIYVEGNYISKKYSNELLNSSQLKSICADMTSTINSEMNPNISLEDKKEISNRINEINKKFNTSTSSTNFKLH